MAMGVALALLQGSVATAASAQTPNATSHAGSQPIFRLDGGNRTYAFGVNERGELQQIYWGEDSESMTSSVQPDPGLPDL